MSDAEESMSDYPTLSEVLDEQYRYRRGVIRAVERFRDSAPWSGTLNERMIKFLTLHTDLCRIYNPGCQLFFSPNIRERSNSGDSYFHMEQRVILLQGRLSVLTYLHEFGHALKGQSEYAACAWSINLFRRVFPDRWERIASVPRVDDSHFMSAPVLRAIEGGGCD
jgi:hypothetical protein